VTGPGPGKEALISTAGQVTIQSSEQAQRIRRVVRIVMVLMIGVLAALAVFFWGYTERAIVQQFQRSSLVLAQLGAKRVEAMFVRIEKELAILAQTCPPGGEKTCATRPAEALAELRPFGARDVFIADRQGRITSTVSNRPETMQPLLDRSLKACRPLSGVCFGLLGGATLPGSPRRESIISLARDQQSANASAWRVGVLFDWTTLGEKINEEVAQGREGLAWLLDDRGHLMYHPSNPAVCNQGVQERDERCQVCHGQNSLSNKMLSGSPGVAAIDVAGSERKLVAFAPVQIAGHRWSLGLASPYAAVVAGNRRMVLIAVIVSGLLIGLLLFVTYFLDLENRRQIRVLAESQAMVQRLNIDLEKKVRERTKELSRVYDSLSEFSRRHESRERLAIVGELASIVAHEIRNPLNALAIGSERLVRKLKAPGDLDPAQALQMVKSQQYEVRRINDYIEQYLKISRVPRIKPRRIDLNKLVADLLEFVEMEGGRLKIELHSRLSARPVIAMADEDQMRQVLLNLILNAFQAMPDGGEVEVETMAMEDGVIVVIRDNGQGIAKEDMDKIFQPFYTTRDGGTGLGLAICARIVGEHGGNLSCESEVGYGTTFRISLPIGRPSGENGSDSGAGG
jgi:signal transduction histidine kinase